MNSFTELKDAFEETYLIKDPYVIKALFATLVCHRLEHMDVVWPIFIAPSGSLKCLGRGTPILMYDGSIKKVEQIKNGDLIMGDDSTPRTVRDTVSGKDELFLIEQKRGDNYIVNKSHVISLKQSTQKKDYKQYNKGNTVDIQLDDYLKKSRNFKKIFKGYKVPVNFQEKKVLIDPYFLGLWLGDGRRDSVSISNIDKEIINYIYLFAKENGFKVSTKDYPGKCNAYYVGEKKMTKPRPKSRIYNAIRSYDLMPEKFIPHDYKINSRKVRLEMLAGLLDTDGSLQKTDGAKNRRIADSSFTFSSKDKRLAKDVVFLSRSLGFHASMNSVSVRLPNKEERRTYWQAYIGGNIEAIPTRVARKQAKRRTRTTNSTITSINVKSIGTGEYFGFSLDGNGRFLLGDCTVTHNTELINSLNKCPDLYALSSLTSRTFISGQRSTSKKSTSLLERIGSGIITFKDLTSLLSENRDERGVIMAQLREIYDGRYAKSFGTGQDEVWEGRLTVIAGSTSVIHSKKRDYVAMGERFIFYNIIQPDRMEAGRKAMDNQEAGDMEQKRAHLTALATAYYTNIVIPDSVSKVDSKLRESLLCLAELATRARSDVERNWRSPTQEITEIHDPEMPTRFAGQLQTIAHALLIMNKDNIGKDGLLQEDIEILQKFALDSITQSRRYAMQELARYDTLTTSGLAVKMDLPTGSVRLRLEDLTALGIAERQKKSGGTSDRWSISPKYRELITHFEKIEYKKEDLLDEEDNDGGLPDEIVGGATSVPSTSGPYGEPE